MYWHRGPRQHGCQTCFILFFSHTGFNQVVLSYYLHKKDSRISRYCEIQWVEFSMSISIVPHKTDHSVNSLSSNTQVIIKRSFHSLTMVSILLRFVLCVVCPMWLWRVVPQRAHVTFFVKGDILEHTCWLLCSIHTDASSLRWHPADCVLPILVSWLEIRVIPATAIPKRLLRLHGICLSLKYLPSINFPASCLGMKSATHVL